MCIIVYNFSYCCTKNFLSLYLNKNVFVYSYKKKIRNEKKKDNLSSFHVNCLLDYPNTQHNNNNQHY